MTDTNNSVVFIIIILFVFFILFMGGNGFGFGGNRNYGSECNHHNHCHTSDAVWANEKQGIIDSARTNYNIIEQNDKTREYLGNKIDAYEYTNLRDRLQAAESKNMFLEGQLADTYRFNNLAKEIADIRYNMCIKAPVYCGGGEAPKPTV